MMKGEQIAETIAQAQGAAGRCGPGRRSVRVPGGLHRQVRGRRPPRTRRVRRHRLHHDSVAVRGAGLRRPARAEEGLDEAVRRHLHPLGLAGVSDSPVTPRGQALARGGGGSRQGSLAGGVRRRRRRRRSDRAVALRPGRQGAQGQRGDREVLRHGDRSERADLQLRKDLPVRRRGSQRRQYRHPVERVRGRRRGGVHLPGERRRPDRRAARLLGARRAPPRAPARSRAFPAR